MSTNIGFEFKFQEPIEIEEIFSDIENCIVNNFCDNPAIWFKETEGSAYTRANKCLGIKVTNGNYDPVLYIEYKTNLPSFSKGKIRQPQVTSISCSDLLCIVNGLLINNIYFDLKEKFKDGSLNTGISIIDQIGFQKFESKKFNSYYEYLNFISKNKNEVVSLLKEGAKYIPEKILINDKKYISLL